MTLSQMKRNPKKKKLCGKTGEWRASERIPSNKNWTRYII